MENDVVEQNNDGVQTSILEYPKVLSEEQLREFNNVSVNVDNAMSYLAQLLGLTDYKFDPRSGIILDYFLGILLFAAKAGMDADQSLALYTLAANIFDILRNGEQFQEAEKVFKSKILALCVPTRKDERQLFSLIDLKNITKFFTSMFFQHYSLYHYCFTKEHYTESRTDVVHIETPLVVPLREALSMEELEAQQRAKEAAIAEAEAAAVAEAISEAEKAREAVVAKAEAEAIATAKAIEEERKKGKPQTLEEAVDLIAREKIAEAKKSLAEHYALQGKVLLEKLTRISQ